MAKIAAIAVVYVLFILILTTDSWVEPLLVLAGLGAAILINNGTNLMFGTISFVTNAAGSILQLAVSLDYSVFLIHRFAECRAARPDASAEDCMVEALCKSTGSILSSGLTTVIGFLALVLMQFQIGPDLGLAPVSYTHLRAHETDSYLVCRLLLEKKKKHHNHKLYHLTHTDND